MISALGPLFFLFLLSKLGKGGAATPEAAATTPAAPMPWVRPPPPVVHPAAKPPMTASTHPATAAATHAAAAATHAAHTGKPSDIATAMQASHAAAILLSQQAQQLTQAKKAPAPWRAAAPTDLPPWPSGWEFDNPPPPAVSTRAWQLLPVLWKSGKPGKRKTETIKGRWITFVAEDHGGGKKGVTAYRIKGGKA